MNEKQAKRLRKYARQAHAAARAGGEVHAIGDIYRRMRSEWLALPSHRARGAASRRVRDILRAAGA